MDVSPGSCGSEATMVVIQRNAPHVDKGLESKETMNPVCLEYWSLECAYNDAEREVRKCKTKNEKE